MLVISKYHSELNTSSGIHIPYSFVYSSRTTREEDTNLTTMDLGKFARQLDNNSLWMLISITPISWMAVTGESGITGDMLKNVYDTNSNGIVDNSEALNGHTSSFFSSTGHLHDQYMVISSYDENQDGTVDNSDKLNGHSSDFFSSTGHLHDQYMVISSYDSNGNGVVDNSEALNGHTSDFFSSTGHIHVHNTLSNIQGGTTDQYYHLTAEQHSAIGTISPPVIKNVSNIYTVLSTDDIIFCNGTFTITLPSATGSGKIHNIKNVGTGIILLEGNSSDTIDGELNQTIHGWENIQIIDGATNTWYIL